MERTQKDIFEAGTSFEDTREAMSLGFFFPSRTLFGVPERESSLILKETKDSAPYRLWATDEPMHMPGSPQPLYGSIPYVTGLTNTSQSAALWINSAQTVIDIDHVDYDGTAGSIVTFTSESGALEFFVFASTAPTDSDSNRVKRVINDLATITGYAPLPMVQTLGFHFCKWAPVSANTLMERSRLFTDNRFPVDVLWADIQWAASNDQGNHMYFQYNKEGFTPTDLDQMHSDF